MPSMYPLVGGTVRQDGSDVQVLVFRDGLVVSMNMGTRQGDSVYVSLRDLPSVAARLVEVLTSHPNFSPSTG